MNKFSGMLLVAFLALPSVVNAREETFTFVDMNTGNPISNATVEVCRFATDISYDNKHPELLIETNRTDTKGRATVDVSVLPSDRVVLHIAGYWTSHIFYSATLSKLAMPGGVYGHIRVVRFVEYNRPILGNSLFDLDARKEYFVSVSGEVKTNSFKFIRIEMKKNGPNAPTLGSHARKN